MIKVPEDFARDTITREGDAGRKWIAELPGRVEDICHKWKLEIDGPVMHGYLGLVVPVQRGGEAYVLKVAWIDDHIDDEAAALTAWNGRGAVKLLEYRSAWGAMLLERLDHSRSLSDLNITEAVTIAGQLHRRLAIPAPTDVRSQQSMAETIFESLPHRWEQYGRPMSLRLLDYTRELAAQVAIPAVNLLVNWDLHYDDVLAGQREPWLAVDPKVVVGDPEFGIAQLLWTRLEEMDEKRGLERHFRILIDAAELDPELARTWTIIRCVDYWLWGLSVGLTYDPARCESIVNRLM